MMKHRILILLLTMVSATLLGQSNDIWIPFCNEDETLFGYKNKDNIIKIEPKFIGGLTNASKFENIIAVSEGINGKWSSYYLTKAGNKVGGVYSVGLGVDCENEGFIRFKDPKTYLIGMLNRNGDVIIPAEYNDLSMVMNGLIVGLKDAEKEYWDNHLSSGHFSWAGGEEVLIDTLNNEIIANFTHDKNLNFFTLKKTDTPSTNTIRKSFLAEDGSYYSFVDFEKEFKQWLANDLVLDLTTEKLINNSYDTISWESTEEWGKDDRRKFVTNNFSTLKNGLLEFLNPESDFFIVKEELNTYSHGKENFEAYFNNCGKYKEWIYPVMNLIISLNHYSFLRTDNGYKLISVVMRNE